MRQDDKRAFENYKVHKKYLSTTKYIVVVIYIFIMPFIETPYWCLSNASNRPVNMPAIYECHAGGENNIYNAPYSQIVNLNPLITDTVDILCLAFLGYFKWFKATWSVRSKMDRYRTYGFYIFSAISILFFLASMAIKWTPFWADVLRPLIIINFLGSLR